MPQILLKLDSVAPASVFVRLTQAREAIPTEPAIWITASKLEEAQGHSHKVDLIIEKAIASMRQFQVIVISHTWNDAWSSYAVQFCFVLLCSVMFCYVLLLFCSCRILTFRAFVLSIDRLCSRALYCRFLLAWPGGVTRKKRVCECVHDVPGGRRSMFSQVSNADWSFDISSWASVSDKARLCPAHMIASKRGGANGNFEICRTGQGVGYRLTLCLW